MVSPFWESVQLSVFVAEQKLRRAQIYRDQNLIKQAQNMPRPSCERLHQMVWGSESEHETLNYLFKIDNF